MSSINWPEILAIFLGFGAFFIFLMNRLDGLRKELKGEIKALDKKIDVLEKEVNRVYSKVRFC
ncbi:LapA family protein [Candidatus Neptunochlamydia vexilliferae]|uniref:LapA family protein n=1 Tax=Candidatus Neptunichlamydia vexilliferae TaxID=1651774 RepID=UPI0018913ACE|nr:LapA family protein [Candidatus Neptunochlamydia vexilliferae]